MVTKTTTKTTLITHKNLIYKKKIKIKVLISKKIKKNKKK
jgi:hypothetical protein